MIKLEDSIIQNLVQLEKVATYELSKNVSEWNEEILDQFFEQINYLPKEFGVDVVVNHVDENEGYAKGSIVVWYHDKRINFPVIVKDYQLSPFDVFIYKDGEKLTFHASTLPSIKKILAADKLGKLENRYPMGAFQGVKSTGGVWPKQSINVADYPELSTPFSKMSCWPILAKKEDLEKFAIQMKAQPNVGQSFVDNTGDLLGNIIDVKGKRIVPEDNKKGILDLKNVITAKRAITVIDSQFFNVNDLMPMKPPSVCEVKLYEYPSMEDFIESGTNMPGRFLATKIGKALSGVVLDYKTSYDMRRGDDRNSTPPLPQEPTDKEQTLEEKRRMRERRDQIFISLDGKYYSTFDDYDKHGIGFYGSRLISNDKAVEQAIKMLSRNTTDDFINHDKQNRSDGADKSFNAIPEMEQGKRGEDCCECVRSGPGRMFVIFGIGDAYDCVSFDSQFRKFKVNGANIYVSNNEAIIPANVSSIQRVSSVKDPVYKMVLGKVKDIYLVPEGALIMNTNFMSRLDDGDFMRPNKSIRKVYEEAEINKIALYVSGDKYKIEGEPFEPLRKLSGVNGEALDTIATLTSLQIMGVETEQAKTAMKVALNRAADYDLEDKAVFIYGVRDDYINKNVFDEIEKTARIKKLFKEFCENLKVNLIKEASVLSDPEAVDVVLSLNFINEDSVKGYVDNIKEMKSMSSKLAELLVASRMGLSNINEGAIKKSMEGLESVIGGLEKVKLAIE